MVPLRIDGQRLWHSLMELAQIGATPKGGVARLALTDLDREGRDWLVARARDAGMAVVAITDHDTLAGVAELRAAGLGDAGPVVVTGIEINTVGTDVLGRHGLGRDGEELHLLGYGLDPAHPGLILASPDTQVISVNTSPAPPCARLPRWTR